MRWPGLILAFLIGCVGAATLPEESDEQIFKGGYPRVLTFRLQLHPPGYREVEAYYRSLHGGDFTRMGSYPVRETAGRESIRMVVPKADVEVWIRPVDTQGRAGAWGRIRSQYEVEDIQ